MEKPAGSEHRKRCEEEQGRSGAYLPVLRSQYREEDRLQASKADRDNRHLYSQPVQEWDESSAV